MRKIKKCTKQGVQIPYVFLGGLKPQQRVYKSSTPLQANPTLQRAEKSLNPGPRIEQIKYKNKPIQFREFCLDLLKFDEKLEKAQKN